MSIAAAVISALEDAEVDQSIALTGSLSVRGQVLPVGGVTAKIEAAADVGIRKVLIPEANMQDVLLESRYQGKIEVASPPPGKPRGTAITLWLPLYQQDDHLPHAQDTDC